MSPLPCHVSCVVVHCSRVQNTRSHQCDWLASSRTKAFCVPAGYIVGAACCPTLNMVGLAAVFPNRPMPFGRQDRSVRLPKIGVTDSTLAIDRRKTGPQPACGRFCLRSDCYADNFACVAVDRQPNPFLAALFADKRPEFIAFQNQAPFFCSVTITERPKAAYLAFT